MTDVVDDLKATLVSLRDLQMPSRHLHPIHDAIHEIVRLRASADQLAAALRDAHGTATRHAVCWCSTDSEYPSDCDSTIALAAYEAARKEEQ